MAKSLLRSTGLVSSMTMISRLLGFARDMVIANIFGATAGVDAYLVAFKIPNFLRRLFAEGAFAQAFVPVLSEYKERQTQEEIQNFVSRMSGTLGLVLLIICILVVIASPLVVMVFAPGFHHGDMRFDLASRMLRITFPYLFFISLTAFAGSVQNTHGHFGIPAITPIFLNICLILAAFLLAPLLHVPIMALAWGIFFAGIVQLLFQLPFMYRLHLLCMPKFDWQDPGVRRVLKLMVPALFGVSVAQINLMLDTVFASFLKVGSVSWLYYSDRLMNFPLGVFGVAIATVILPNLSRKHASNSVEAYSKTMDWGIRSIFLIGVPSAIGLFILAGPLLSTLLGYGHFTHTDVIMSRKSLLAFAIGVPSFMMIKVLASGFYAQQNIRTPVKIAALAMLTNMVLNAILIFPLAHAGLALATSIAAMLNAGLLFIGIRRRGIYQAAPGWGKFALQMLLANGVMALWLWWGSDSLNQWFAWHWWIKAGHLFYLIAVAMILYFAILRVMGMRVRDFRLH